jgi:hypothetical protein
METLGAALTTIRLALLLLLLAAAAGWVLRWILLIRRQPLVMGRIEALAESGFLGFDVEPGSAGGYPAMTLVAPDAPEPAAAIRLDTDASGQSPAELLPLDLGVRALDARFAVRAADDCARRGMEAARSGALQMAGDFFDGWAARFARVSVADSGVHFAFGSGQAQRLEEVLPYMGWVAKALLSAAWWLPPSRLPSSGAFRGGPELAASAPVWYLELPGRADRAGPLDLEQVVELLRRGRISWLTRASQGADGSASPTTPTTPPRACSNPACSAPSSSAA